MAIRNTSRVDKKDYDRVLLSETIPSDSPIIFSNKGFYEIVKSHTESRISSTTYIAKAFDEIFNLKNLHEHHSATIPFKYSILKNETKIRGLSLLHPRAQYFLKSFIEKNFASIIYYCSRSNFSLRKPSRVASEYTPKSDVNNTPLGVPSFFSIEGIDRLYKFFESGEFMKLESRFPYYASADVSNCFNSIYTHTIPWATHGKEYNSNLIRNSNLFANEFDTRMQRSNSNETNGIPIGNEISRIFSEILFQSIDIDIENSLKEKGYSSNTHYQINRYVDDFFIFALNRKILSDCLTTITSKLHKLNFVLNDKKTIIYERPFFSKVSCIATETKTLLSNLDKSIFTKVDKSKTGSKYTLKPVYRPSGMASKFVARVRAACLTNDGTYGDVASLVIGSIMKKLEIVENCLKDNEKKVKPINTLILFIEIIFFFYNSNPQSSTSRIICLIILKCDELISRFSADDSQFYKEAVTQQINSVLEGSTNAELSSENGKFLPFEKLNILLSTCFFEDFNKYGNEFLLEFIKDKTLNYFDIISLLFYTQGKSHYSGLIQELEQAALDISKSKKSIFKCSEKCHLTLDLLSCPFVSLTTKYKLFKNFEFLKGHSDISTEFNHAINEFESVSWFVEWKEKDLKTLIVGKELIRGY